MRTILCALTMLLMGLTGVQAEGLKPIVLNSPNKSRGASIMKALSDRHSEREFAARQLSGQDLSDLLWAANGINRQDGKRTAASALNKQDIDIYVLMRDGAYLYDYKSHLLKPVAEGDHRPLIGGKQASVNEAPVCLLMISDISRFGQVGTPQLRERFGALDAGLVSQNISLFCSGCGLVTVPRASMDVKGLKRVLKLSDSQIPMINHPVGYKR